MALRRNSSWDFEGEQYGGIGLAQLPQRTQQPTRQTTATAYATHYTQLISATSEYLAEIIAIYHCLNLKLESDPIHQRMNNRISLLIFVGTTISGIEKCHVRKEYETASCVRITVNDHGIVNV